MSYGKARELAYLPFEVQDWADLPTVPIDSIGKPLVIYNDLEDKTFAELADIIEKDL